MKERPDVIILTEEETGEELKLTVVEQTTFGGKEYLLVTEDELGEDEAYVLEYIRGEGDDAIYEFVDDDDLLESLAEIFETILADTEEDDDEE